ncbi:MAG: phosphoenolpyruvate carboxylase [Steroidobacteraceae bacterium]
MLDNYLQQLNGLGAELSISSELDTPTTELLALADASGDTSPARQDEPYRRGYARLAATYEHITGRPPARRATVPGVAYRTPEELRTDLVAIAHSLAQRGAGLLATGGALGRLIRAVDSFGFHLATLDLRQNSDVHARVGRGPFECSGGREPLLGSG